MALAAGKEGATEGEHGLRALATPTRVPLGRRLFEAGLDDYYAGGFDGATANGQAEVAEVGIAHALMKEIEHGFADGKRQGFASGKEQTNVVKMRFSITSCSSS